MSGSRLLASYPRSGNTWVRAVLTALARGDGALDINALEGPMAAQRDWFDAALEVETSDLLADELCRLRPLAWRIATAAARRRFPVKTHDAFLPAADGAGPPFLRDDIETVVLIVRDPRDIAPSFATYFGVTIDRAIALMGNPGFRLGQTDAGLAMQLPQLVSSWSRHTTSWLDAGLPLTVVRYEDLLAAPLQGFATIAGALHGPATPQALAAAIEAASLARLRADEARTGFRESSPHAPNRFFGPGAAGGWRHRLTPAQADRIRHDHGAVMQALGYGA